MVSGISYHKVGTSYIQEKAKMKNKGDFGGNLCCAPEHSLQPWRISSVKTSLAYAI